MESTFINRIKELGLDNKDREIMYQLDVDARRSNSEIAKIVNLDKNVVNYRIKRLQEKGVIDYFYTLIDMARLGYQAFRVYFKWQYITPEKEQEIYDYISNSKQVWWCGIVDGEWNVVFLVWVKDNYKFRDFLFDILSKYQTYIQKQSVSVYTGLYHFPYTFLSLKKIESPEMQFIGDFANVEVSKTDKKILQAISMNARKSTVELAKELDLTPAIIKYNLNKLKKHGIIKGFRTAFNFDLLGLTYYKSFFHLKDRSKYKELLEFARVHPNIIYVDEAIGMADFEPNILTESHKQFKELMQKMAALFKGSLKEYDYVIFPKILAIRYYVE